MRSPAPTAWAPEVVRAHVDRLVAARRDGTTCPPATALVGEQLSRDTAYWIQDEVLRREADEVVGVKLAHAALRDGMPEGEVGWLTRGAAVPPGGVVPPLGAGVSVEAEVAVVLGADVTEPVSRDRVAEAIASLHPALDVITSRFAPRSSDRWDLVADNAFAGAHSMATTPGALGATPWQLCVDEGVVAEGAPAHAALDPVTATTAVAMQLAQRGHGLRAGHVVLTGRLMPVVHVAAGSRVTIRIGGTDVLTVRLASPDIEARHA